MKASRIKARITGLGSYLPEGVLSNADLEKMVETSDEWIYPRTGIKERRIADKDECTSHMGAKAARKAIKAAGIQADEIDLILVATMSPDYLAVNTGALIQRELGLSPCGTAAMDLQAACSGHVYGLSTAKALIESGIYKTILLVSSEKMSSFVNYKDRRTCVLFGDGASAVIVQAEGAGFELGIPSLGADGSEAELLYIPSGGARAPASAESVTDDSHYIAMEGQPVFKSAVRKMALAAEKCLEVNGWSLESVDWVVPHQANKRIIDATVKRLGFSPDKVYSECVRKYGNNSSASVAVAFDELNQYREVEVGDQILLVVFGAGFTWGAIPLTKVEA